MLRNAGLPVDRKTPAERDLMAEVGSALEKYNGYRTTATAGKVYAALKEEEGCFFVHMREPRQHRQDQCDPARPAARGCDHDPVRRAPRCRTDHQQ